MHPIEAVAKRGNGKHISGVIAKSYACAMAGGAVGQIDFSYEYKRRLSEHRS